MGPAGLGAPSGQHRDAGLGACAGAASLGVGGKARAGRCPGTPSALGSPAPSALVRSLGSALAESCGDVERLGGLWCAGASLQQGESSLRRQGWLLSGRRAFSYTALSINVPLRWLFPPPLGRVAVPGLPRCCDTMLALSAGSCRCLASIWPLLWNVGGRRRRSLSPSWWQQ